jgi:hypothetical protein
MSKKEEYKNVRASVSLHKNYQDKHRDNQIKFQGFNKIMQSTVKIIKLFEITLQTYLMMT